MVAQVADSETFPSDVLAATRASALRYSFYPRGTVRCTGIAAYRSQAARDLCCVLDLDPAVDAWACLPFALSDGFETHVPDAIAYRGNGHVTLLDVLTPDRPILADWIASRAREHGYSHEAVSYARLSEGPRVMNCRDLLRYARWECALGDRIRVLAALDEVGELPLIEALSAFQETRPIASLASLVLGRFLAMDLDAERIGPTTPVRRFPG